MSKTAEFITLGAVVFVAALAANLVALKVAADIAEVKLNEARPAGGMLGLLAKIAS